MSASIGIMYELYVNRCWAVRKVQAYRALHDNALVSSFYATKEVVRSSNFHHSFNLNLSSLVPHELPHHIFRSLLSEFIFHLS